MLADLPAVPGAPVCGRGRSRADQHEVESGTMTRSCRYQVPVAVSPVTVISGWVTRCSVTTVGPHDERMKSTRSVRLVKCSSLPIDDP